MACWARPKRPTLVVIRAPAGGGPGGAAPRVNGRRSSSAASAARAPAAGRHEQLAEQPPVAKRSSQESGLGQFPGPVGEDEVGAGPLDGRQLLDGHGGAVEPSPLGGGL